jgi:hypothetical protein
MRVRTCRREVSLGEWQAELPGTEYTGLCKIISRSINLLACFAVFKLYRYICPIMFQCSFTHWFSSGNNVGAHNNPVLASRKHHREVGVRTCSLAERADGTLSPFTDQMTVRTNCSRNRLTVRPLPVVKGRAINRIRSSPLLSTPLYSSVLSARVILLPYYRSEQLMSLPLVS